MALIDPSISIGCRIRV